MVELEEAVKQMANDKAPGLDGFTTNFFHACWDWVKEEVLEIVEASRKTRCVLKSFNSTFLTLIRNDTIVADLSKFRPIALCNDIYNIITKVILNKLRPLLPRIISRE